MFTFPFLKENGGFFISWKGDGRKMLDDCKHLRSSLIIASEVKLHIIVVFLL
jgi:hypothetical protein